MITFRDWIFSIHPNGDSYSGQWKFPHIFTLCLCIALSVAIALVFRKRTKSTRKSVIKVLAVLILVFEVSRRVINFAKGDATDFNSTMYLLLPRPWCAISCWAIIIAAVTDKKAMYNVACICALLCAVIFFSYPSAGFNHKHILFENLYSISTHALLLITSVSILTLKIGDFRYKRETFKKGMLKELILFAVMYAYGFLELFVLKISSDPLYFMPNNEVHEILGMGYGLYLVLYIVFMLVWVNAFYIIPKLWIKYVKKGVVEDDTKPKKVQSGRYVKTKGGRQ